MRLNSYIWSLHLSVYMRFHPEFVIPSHCGLVLTRNMLIKGFLLVSLKICGRHQTRNYHNDDHEYVSFVLFTIMSFFLLSWLLTRFIQRITSQVPMAEQELLTISEHLISPWFCLWFVLCNPSNSSVLLRFTASNYPFIWYLQTFIVCNSHSIWNYVRLSQPSRIYRRVQKLNMQM